MALTLAQRVQRLRDAQRHVERLRADVRDHVVALVRTGGLSREDVTVVVRAGAMSEREIARVSGLSRTTVRRWLDKAER